eukprot:5920634-Amphidinium_carterae.1
MDRAMAAGSFFGALPSSFKSMRPAPPTHGHGKKVPQQSFITKMASMASGYGIGPNGSAKSVEQAHSPAPLKQKQVQVAGTEVPEDLYKELVKAGERARRRGQHRLVKDHRGQSDVQERKVCETQTTRGF